MRKIISRGKRKDNGAWETGSLVVIRPGCSDESVYIADKMTGYYTPVDPNTVGEFSSFEDKNSKQIFEGDIVQHKTDYGCYKYVVVFENGQFCFKNGSRCIGMKHVVGLGEDLEIIGNVYDNPYLSPA